MASKQKHDIGRQKRMKAAPIMQAAAFRRFTAKQRRLTRGSSPFFERWLKFNYYRPYYTEDD